MAVTFSITVNDICSSYTDLIKVLLEQRFGGSLSHGILFHTNKSVRVQTSNRIKPTRST